MKFSKFLSLLIGLGILFLPMGNAHAKANYSVLKMNDQGVEVTKLQQELKNQGYSIEVDSIYGETTKNIISKFQKDNNLLVDGIAGIKTQELLFNKNSNTSKAANNSIKYTDNDVFWLARIIQAEAGGESYQGKVAVGNVVLNRVKSKDFPNTIYSVIFEYYGKIPQFSPVAEGTIYNTPSAESVKAAKDALNGARPVGNSTYFFNPAKAAGTWIVKNKTYIMKIGGHSFYA